MLNFNQFTISFIRHAQSEVNATPDIVGQNEDSQLSAVGRRQAQLLGLRFDKEFLSFDRVYSSTYIRALDTAKIALPNQQSIITTSELREYDAGLWTQSKRSEVITPAVKLQMGYMASGFLPPKGESMHQVERRASRWLEDTIVYNKQICEDAYTNSLLGHDKLNIAVFSHGMTIKCLLHYIMGFDQNFIWRLTLENTSICKLVYGEEGWRLITINDHSHLL